MWIKGKLTTGIIFCFQSKLDRHFSWRWRWLCERICKYQTKVGNTEEKVRKEKQSQLVAAEAVEPFLLDCKRSFKTCRKEQNSQPLPLSNSKITTVSGFFHARKSFCFYKEGIFQVIVRTQILLSLSPTDITIVLLQYTRILVNARGGHVSVWSNYPNETTNRTVEYDQFLSVRFCQKDSFGLVRFRLSGFDFFS